MLRYQCTTTPSWANSPAALLGAPSSSRGALPSCVRKHGGQICSTKTCQQRHDTAPSPAQAPNCTSCDSDCSEPLGRACDFRPRDHQALGDLENHTRNAIFRRSVSGGPSFHIARAKTLGDALASAPGRVLDTGSGTFSHNAANVRTLLAGRNECPALAQKTAEARTRCSCLPESRRRALWRRPSFVGHTTADVFDLRVLRVKPKRPRASGGGRVSVNSGTCGCQSTPRHIHHRPSSGTTVASEPVLVDVESHNGGNEAYMLNGRSRTNRYATHDP